MKRLIMTLALAAMAMGCGNADIKEDCTVNGYGAGKCSFSNTGDAEGSKCISIDVFRYEDFQSAGAVTVCSGVVAPMSTKDATFQLVGLDDMCKNDDGKWFDVCGLFVNKTKAQMLADWAEYLAKEEVK